MKLNFFSLILNTVIFVAFMAVLLFALMYANGLTFDIAEIELAKTGMIYVDGSGDQVMKLDGKEVATSLPATISGLVPGRYLLSWDSPALQKREQWLNVKTDVVTYVEEKIPVNADIQSSWQQFNSAWVMNQNWFLNDGKLFRINGQFLEIADRPSSLNWRKVVDLKTDKIKLKGVDLWLNQLFYRDQDNQLWQYDTINGKNIRFLSINRRESNYLQLVWQESDLAWGREKAWNNLDFTPVKIANLKADYWKNGWLVKLRDQYLNSEQLFYLNFSGFIKLDNSLLKLIAVTNQKITWQNQQGQIWSYDGEKRLIKNYWSKKEVLNELWLTDHYLVKEENKLLLEDWRVNREFILTENLGAADHVWVESKTIYWWNGKELRYLTWV